MAITPVASAPNAISRTSGDATATSPAGDVACGIFEGGNDVSDGDATTGGDYLSERGRQAAVEMFGPGGDAFMERNNRRWAERVDPDWARIMNEFIINGCYSRNILPTDVRELCAVAALTVLARSDELTAHIRIALRSNPPEKVREVLLQMAVYGGMPVALDALRIFDRVIAEPDADY
jgi:4-carboxymuconolactone decarboxylase